MYLHSYTTDKKHVSRKCCIHKNTATHTLVYLSIYLSINLFIYLCVCVCTSSNGIQFFAFFPHRVPYFATFLPPRPLPWSRASSWITCLRNLPPLRE